MRGRSSRCRASTARARRHRPHDSFVLLDIDPRKALQRLSFRAEQSHQSDEDITNLADVHAMYLALAAVRDDVFVADSDRPTDDVAAEILAVVSARLR